VEQERGSGAPTAAACRKPEKKRATGPASVAASTARPSVTSASSRSTSGPAIFFSEGVCDNCASVIFALFDMDLVSSGRQCP